MLGVRQIITTVLALVSFVACNNSSLTASASTRDGGPITAPIPLSEVATITLQVACEKSVQCRLYPNVAQCMGAQLSGWEQAIAGVKAGRTQYDGNAAAECFNALRAQPPACNWTEANTNPPACTQVFQGMGARGARCFPSGADCISSRCTNWSCSSDLSCCPGTCGDPPDTAHPIPLGGDCSALTAVCAHGLRCDHSSTSGTCVSAPPHLSAGQDCNPNDPSVGDCWNNTKCKPSSSALGGTCTPLPKEGEPCDLEAYACDSWYDYCDPVAGKCMPMIAVGQPCPSGYGCVSYAGCVSGTCVSKTGLGEACDDGAVLYPCMGFLLCDKGVCTVPTELSARVCP